MNQSYSSLLVTWLCAAVSLTIVSKLRLGFEVAKFSSALIVAIAVGIASALVRPAMIALKLPLVGLAGTALLVAALTIANAMAVVIAGQLIAGFRVRGLVGALVGSFALSVITAAITEVVSRFL